MKNKIGNGSDGDRKCSLQERNKRGSSFLCKRKIGRNNLNETEFESENLVVNENEESDSQGNSELLIYSENEIDLRTAVALVNFKENIDSLEICDTVGDLDCQGGLIIVPSVSRDVLVCLCTDTLMGRSIFCLDFKK